MQRMSIDWLLVLCLFGLAFALLFAPTKNYKILIDDISIQELETNRGKETMQLNFGNPDLFQSVGSDFIARQDQAFDRSNAFDREFRLLGILTKDGRRHALLLHKPTAETRNVAEATMFKGLNVIEIGDHHIRGEFKGRAVTLRL